MSIARAVRDGQGRFFGRVRRSRRTTIAGAVNPLTVWHRPDTTTVACRADQDAFVAPAAPAAVSQKYRHDCGARVIPWSKAHPRPALAHRRHIANDASPQTCVFSPSLRAPTDHVRRPVPAAAVALVRRRRRRVESACSPGANRARPTTAKQVARPARRGWRRAASPHRAHHPGEQRRPGDHAGVGRAPGAGHRKHRQVAWPGTAARRGVCLAAARQDVRRSRPLRRDRIGRSPFTRQRRRTPRAARVGAFLSNGRRHFRQRCAVAPPSPAAMPPSAAGRSHAYSPALATFSHLGGSQQPVLLAPVPPAGVD
ncbi:hypothetical protein ACPA9J_27110 [Pseudomonas aeruginosa]